MNTKQSKVGKAPLSSIVGDGVSERIDMQAVGNVMLMDYTFIPGALSANSSYDCTAPTDARPAAIRKLPEHY